MPRFGFSAPHKGIQPFLRQSAPEGKVLDVGCGNNSPYVVKSLLPRCHYTGLDIGDYNQTRPNMADAYVITSPEAFASTVESFTGAFDTVISAHNIEHCDERERTLRAMLKALKVGGQIFMAFPSQQSVRFPKRAGCLNYYDDGSHTGTPPDFARIITIMREYSLNITFAAPQYRPMGEFLIGLKNELQSTRQKKVLPGTWALWGFEAIIWAQKPPQP